MIQKKKRVVKKATTKKRVVKKTTTAKKRVSRRAALCGIYDYDAVAILNYHVGHKTPKGYVIDYEIDVDETDLAMVKETVKEMNKYSKKTYIVVYTVECYEPKKNVRNWFDTFDEVFDATTKRGAFAAMKKHYGANAKIWDYEKDGRWGDNY